MGPLRTLLIAAATPLAILLPMQSSAHAQSAPLSLTPPSLQAKKPAVTHQSRARKSTRVARPHAAPAAVATAATEATSAGASAQAVALQDADGLALIARLPWWRSDDWGAARNSDKTESNQLLAVARSWMGPGAVSVAAEPSDAKAAEVAQATSADVGTDDSLAASALADANELNTIDLGAGDPGTQRSSLVGLLVMLAGALAAAATACFLFGFRRSAIVLTE
jgi:hypothetical protein